jgi:hypothetical protein
MVLVEMLLSFRFLYGEDRATTRGVSRVENESLHGFNMKGRLKDCFDKEI